MTTQLILRSGRHALVDGTMRFVPPTSLTELLAHPDVVEQCELRSTFGLMAIHGGGLERMTDVIAASAAELAGASYYAVVHPVDVDHHLSSLRYRVAESPTLAAFVEHVDVVVSIHGYGREGSWTSILAGGRNRRLATAVADEAATRLNGYEVITDLGRIPVELRGLSARNPVNLPPARGVQLELPPRVRGLSPFSPPPGDDGFSPPTRALIDVLATVARRWQ
jgi:phage replication-related protein YjqB (UPF0714/DUF867 family)